MGRNLDITALRAFVTVAEAGGVTRASGLLHLTQSAVSMQVKRLETMLERPLFQREGRGLRLTVQGEELLSYGRKMLELNDMIVSRMTEPSHVGELSIGVPHDIVFPHIPKVLQQIAAAFPDGQINFASTFTKELKERFARGEMDLILTTEMGCEEGGETIRALRLAWCAAKGGKAALMRPLPLAFSRKCAFAPHTTAALDAAGIPWKMVADVGGAFNQALDATVLADLGVQAMLEGTIDDRFEVLEPDGNLPELPEFNINMFVTSGTQAALAAEVAQMMRTAFRPMKQVA